MRVEDLTNAVRLSPASRRSFMQKLGVATAAVAGTAAMGKSLQAQSSITDFDILNFALNLEYLEAEFYTYATTGAGISTLGIDVTGTGASGSTTGGSKVTFSDSTIQAVAMELAEDEQQHVVLIKNAIASLGGKAIAKPAINLAALGIGFANQSDFLTLSRVFEDIGVTAYGGAAPLISSSLVLGYAARILAVEAFHSGNIRAQIARLGISTSPLDGADHAPPPSGSMYFPTDSNALSEVRSPGQVLYLAFGAANVSSGGFFPSGVNGTLNTSSAGAAATDGASLSISPNPISVSGNGDGVATISWNAPGAQVIQIRVGSPTGPLFTDNFSSGSMQTGSWVTDGMTFYLQDVSNSKALNSVNTLATAVAHVTHH